VLSVRVCKIALYRNGGQWMILEMSFRTERIFDQGREPSKRNDTGGSKPDGG
jgi:hypothetical protein